MGAPGGSDRVAPAELTREGDYWSLVFDGREWRVRDSKGMQYLAELLARPNVDIPALQLAQADGRVDVEVAETVQAGLTAGAGSDAAPLLDARAKAAYRDRLRDLQAELEEAERFHDSERAARARAEYEFVADELSSAVGLSGRDRRTGTPEERSRVNVTRTIKAAIAHLDELDPQLGAHLAATVLTGRACVYRPERADPVAWRVRTRPSRARLERRFHPPKTQYARSGDLSIAYQVLGDGPTDLVLMYGWLSHLDFVWTDPAFTRLLRRLAAEARVIVFDKRGCGLSDPVSGTPTLEDRMDDIQAVMDAAGSARATIVGYSEGGCIGALFAAAHPDRTAALVMYETWVCGLLDPERNPAFEKWAALDRLVRAAIAQWGEGATLDFAAPTIASNTAFRRMFGAFERASMSPGMAAALWDTLVQEDIRPILPMIHVPTLIVHHTDSTVPVEHARYAAEHIGAARYVELPGRDHAPFAQNVDRIADEITAFLSDEGPPSEPDRVLATVLCIGQAHQLEPHSSLLRDQIERFQGRAIQLTAARIIASFDAPARAVRCARETRDRLLELGITTTAALHTGECELQQDAISGVAVSIAEQLLSHATAAQEIIVSGTLKDLVIGSGIEFEARGDHELHGVPGRWPTFAVTGDARERTVESAAELAPLVPRLDDRLVRTIARHAPRVARATIRATRPHRPPG